jgi:hypothetical protein
MSNGKDAVPGAERWFSSVDLNGAPDAAVRVIRELVRMLDQVQPQLLDPGRCRVRSSDPGGRPRDRTVEIALAHLTEPDSDVSVVVDSDGAVVYWLGAHEHVDASDDAARRPWTTVVVDVAHSVLRGAYAVENHYRGNLLVRMKIIDTADPNGPRVVEDQGSLLTAWIPWPRMSRIELRRVDFGLRD